MPVKNPYMMYGLVPYYKKEGQPSVIVWLLLFLPCFRCAQYECGGPYGDNVSIG